MAFFNSKLVPWIQPVIKITKNFKLHKQFRIDKNTNIQKLVLGTHTSNKENEYLIIAKARIPTQEYSSDVKDTTKPEPGSANPNNNRFEIETKINHSSEINKARINPKKSNIIATKTTSGEVYLFNYHKHPPKSSENVCKPDQKLVGHSKEGYALNWSNLKENYLISGADDNKVKKLFKKKLFKEILFSWIF